MRILESIRNKQAAHNVQDVMSKLNALERRHQEHYRQAVATKEPEFVKMKTHGISVYPEVFKKADLMKVRPDSIVEELMKSTNIDFEKDSYSEIRDVATTTLRNYMNAHAHRGGEVRGRKRRVWRQVRRRSGQRAAQLSR